MLRLRANCNGQVLHLWLITFDLLDLETAVQTALFIVRSHFDAACYNVTASKCPPATAEKQKKKKKRLDIYLKWTPQTHLRSQKSQKNAWILGYDAVGISSSNDAMIVLWTSDWFSLSGLTVIGGGRVLAPLLCFPIFLLLAAARRILRLVENQQWQHYSTIWTPRYGDYRLYIRACRTSQPVSIPPEWKCSKDG